jgi:hypothetical protein
VATTVAERKLLVDGEWIETGEWLDVRSPYSGEVLGRVAKAGAAETRRAIDAAEVAMREPLPAHKRAEILVKVAGGLGRRHDEVARLISQEAGKPMKAARVEAKRAMSTYTFAAVEARKLAGEMVPMDAAQAGEGLKIRLLNPAPIPLIARELKAPGKGLVTLIVPGTSSQEIEIALPRRVQVNPQLKNLISTMSGVAEVESV